MPANDFNTQLWGQFTQAISAKLGTGATNAAIQVLPASMPLPDTIIDTEMLDAISQFVNILPQWGSAYNPSTAAVDSAYQIVLTQIEETATNGKSIQQQYNIEQKKLSDMSGNASKYKLSQIAQYKTDTATYKDAGLPVPTFDAWFADNGQQAYQSLVTLQDHQLKVVQTLLSAAGVASPLVKALDDLNTGIKAHEQSVAFPVVANPNVSIITSWKTKKTNPGGVTFSDKSTTYDYSKSLWQSQSGYDLFGFISVGKRDATTKSENILSATSAYTMDIEYASQASIAVERDWVNGALLKLYKGGPWITGAAFANGAAHPYGDATAVFPLMITSIYVVLNPKVSITLDLSSYKSIFQQISDNLSNGVNIGPFAFGGTGNSNDAMICQVSAFKESQTFTVKDTSGIPQVIAVVCQPMP